MYNFIVLCGEACYTVFIVKIDAGDRKMSSDVTSLGYCIINRIKSFTVFLE
jgi:hypothetical protein